MTIPDQAWGPWMGLLVGLAAMAPFTIQAIIFRRNQQRQRTWVRAVAVVERIGAWTNSDNGTTYDASYTYVDSQGRSHRGTGDVDAEKEVGTELPIIHDPHDSTRSQLWRDVGAGHWIAGTLGFLLFGAGVFGLVQSTLLIVR